MGVRYFIVDSGVNFDNIVKDHPACKERERPGMGYIDADLTVAFAREIEGGAVRYGRRRCRRGYAELEIHPDPAFNERE